MLVGAGLGALLRVWMRLISDDPEFSWSGTIFIVGAFVVLGTTSGLVAFGRGRGWRASLVVTRLVGAVLGLACFTGAGAVMLFTIVPGALAVGRREWPAWARWPLGALAVAGTLAIGLGLAEVPMSRRLLALPLFAAASVVEVRLFSELLAPSVVRLPRAVRWSAWAAPALVFLLVAMTAVGV
jgi:hypothetical protein